MSELAAMACAAFGGVGRFRGDVRFAPGATLARSVLETRDVDPPSEQAPAEDPGALAFAEGYAAGIAEAHVEAALRADADAEAHASLSLAFSRLDTQLQEQLRSRLRDTVAALCTQAIAPLALDEPSLIRRIARATAMLARSDDERVIRLNPADLKLLSPSFRASWEIQPDAALERGALRVEGHAGGVEDGPEQWRRTIAEALHRC